MRTKHSPRGRAVFPLHTLQVAQYGGNLTSLNLRFLEELTDKSPSAIAENCSQLEVLVLFGLKHVRRSECMFYDSSLEKSSECGVGETTRLRTMASGFPLELPQEI